MKKALVVSLGLLLAARLAPAESLRYSRYAFIVASIEEYLGGGQGSMRDVYLFDCRIDPDFHSGYAQNEAGYFLGTSPYTPVARNDVDRSKVVIDIALDGAKGDILVYFRYDGKWYGFRARLLNTRLAKVPRKLYETD